VTILSTAATAIASVLALVFAISLVVVQLSSEYSHRMASAFVNAPTLAYVFFSVVAILFSMWYIAAPRPWAVKLSFLLAAAFLLFLLPYFLALKHWLNPELVMDDLKRGAAGRLQRTGDGAGEEIVTIDDAVLSAFGMKDYATFERGVTALADLAYAAYADGKEAAGAALVARLVETGFTTMEDPVAPVRVVKALASVGLRAVAGNVGPALEETASGLGQVGVRAAEHGLVAAAQWTADSLRELGVRAAEGKMAAAAWHAADALREVGVQASEQGLKGPAERAASCMGAVGVKAVEFSLEFAAWQAANALGDLGVKAAEHNLAVATARAAAALGAIGTRAAERAMPDAVEETVSALWVLGAWAALRKDVALERRIVEAVESVEGAAPADALDGAFARAAAQLAESPLLGAPELPALLPVFRDAYRRRKARA
jgi:hypothetical protein